jgi:hypothetical protein
MRLLVQGTTFSLLYYPLYYPLALHSTFRHMMTPGNFTWFLHTMLFYHTKHVIEIQRQKENKKVSLRKTALRMNIEEDDN